MPTVERARTRRLRTGQRGSTLFELAAVLAIMGLFLTTVYAGIDSLTSATAGTDSRLVNLNEARTLIDVATKDVRTAVRLQAGASPFVIAADNEIEFYANLLPNPTVVAPRRIHIYVDSQNRLIEEVMAPDASSVAPNYTYVDPNNHPTTRFVGRYVANDAAHPIFTYYDNSVPPVKLTPTPLGAQNLLAVHSVQILLMIRRSAFHNTGFTTVQNAVRLPNLDFAPVIS
ncbi:MAG: hypothetical protein JOZ99_07140 [Actinobacteria bacterium]|nr:hypothetical protein [Actinomycetota bacterium]